MYQHSDSQSVIPVLLGNDRNITYILDTSEAMATVLGKVKNMIIQSLLTKASLRNSLFNIISISYKITSLSEHMIPCAPDTVYQALSWIHTLRTSPGNDLLTALITAFSDPACQSVHLVTNSLPDNPEQCLNALSAITARPVHTFYISEKPDLDRNILDFLKCLTSATKGSCYRLSLNSNDSAEQVNPSVALLHSSEHQTQHFSCSGDRCQVSSSKPFHPVCISPYWCSMGNRFSVTPCVLGKLARGQEFFSGCRVLARREIDGFYYLGTIVHQLQDRGGLFMVTFDTCLPKDETMMETVSSQLICQSDMLNITQAHTHNIVPGDTVLAPWEPQMNRYGPGRVVSGMEVRDPLKGGVGDGLVVLFWNEIRSHIPKNLAVWIPASLHERIIRELQSNVFRASCLNHSHCNHINWSPVCCLNHTNHYPSTTPSMCFCPVTSYPFSNQCLLINNEWKGQEIKTDQLKKLTTSQEMDNDLSSLDSSEDEKEVANEKQPELVSRSVNTEISCLKKVHTEPHIRPTWRYWKRGSPEPHHKKPGHIVKPPNPGDSSIGINIDSGYSSSSFSTTNHSSVFEMVPHSLRRGVTVREVFGGTLPKPLSEAPSPLAFAVNKLSTEPR
ncbi:uncharacterized protein C11orf16 homolog [Silurus meridionalis]|uniref:DUF4537 domain-containing protein n=1 Tax=Silurus meridionalis TaxID=175797 RepID=A0A8T0B0T8_SILME|nr:uncharacterized protein C11orf16 homolog [Silurus meridionalis]KAF7699014.1 hypothetical protein HF521_003756 [Silurus meridionalis]